MVGLLDVNVLVALIVPEHEHHDAALSWYAGADNEGWATCAVTELGVIRVCAQLPGGGWPPERTADQLLILTADGRAHEFWPDALSPAVMPEVRTAQTANSSPTDTPSDWLDATVESSSPLIVVSRLQAATTSRVCFRQLSSRSCGLPGIANHPGLKP